MQHFRGFAGGCAKLMILLTFFGQVISCGGSQDEPSSLNHNADEPVRLGQRGLWQEVSASEFESVYLPTISDLMGWSSIKYLDINSSQSQLVARWLDRYDEYLRIQFPSLLKDIPKPKPLVVVNQKVNAAVMPIPLCLDVPVTFSQSSGTRLVDKVVLNSDGKIDRFQGSSCIPVSKDSVRFEEVIKRWNHEMTSCSINVDHGESILGSKCDLSSRLRGVSGAKQLVLYVTSNVIVFSSAVLTEFNEAQFGAVAAHELGHYYRSHLTAASVSDDYNFFYQVEDVGPEVKHRPIADPQWRELGKQVAEIDLPTRSYRRISGQRFRSELFRPIISLTRIVNASFECSQPESCNNSCEVFQDWMNHSEEFRELSGFPFTAITNPLLNAYQAFEDKATACLGSVKIVPFGAMDGSSISPSISSDFFMSALSDDHEIFERFLSEVVPTSNALESISLVGDLLAKKIDENRKPLYQAAKSRLGFYTFEQEADELSIEWMTDIGHATSHALEVEFLYAEMHDKEDRSLGIDLYPFITPADECRGLYNNGWRDELGNEVFIPIADYQDAHHSSCYRAYNLSREIKVHGYQQGEGQFNEERAAWAELRNLARSWDIEGNDVTDILTYRPSRDSRSLPNRGVATLGMCAFNR